MKKTLMILMAVMLLAGSASAQFTIGKGESSQTQLFSKPKGFLDALFDPSRFSMSHSYSMSVGSVGSQTYNQGLYLNTMTWKLADPLLMQIRVGYAHQPFGQSNFYGQTAENGKLFLQQAYFEYKPSKNTKLSFEYQQVPAQMYFASPFGLGTRSERW